MYSAAAAALNATDAGVIKFLIRLTFDITLLQFTGCDDSDSNVLLLATNRSTRNSKQADLRGSE